MSAPTAALDGRADPADDGRPSRFERAVDRVPFLAKELALLRALTRPDTVAVDVGAAGGAHLLAVARGLGPDGRVVGVEPRPGSLRALRWVVRAAGVADRVTLVGAALGAAPGRTALRVPIVPTRAHVPGSGAAGRGGAAFPWAPARTIDVPVRTLDEVVAAHGLGRVDLLKLDVEGAEREVLAGGRDTLARSRPVLLVEAHDAMQARDDGATAQDLLDALAALGFDAYRYRRGGLEATGGRTVPGEDDYVLVPTERPAPLPPPGVAAATAVTAGPRGGAGRPGGRRRP